MRIKARFLAFCMLAVSAVARPCAAIELGLERAIPAGSDRITALVFSPDGAKVLFGTGNGAVTILDVETGEGTIIAAGGKEITALALSPDGSFAAIAQKDKGVRCVGLKGEASSIELREAKGRIGVLAFSGDGRYLAAGGDKKDVFVWETPSGRIRSRLKGHDGEILAIAFHDAEGSIISIGRDRKMIVWDAASSKPLRRHDLEARTMPDAGIDVTAAAISADRLFAVVGIEEHVLEKGGEKMIFKWHTAFFDVSKGVLLKMLENDKCRIEHIALYPGNCFIACDNSTRQEHSIALRNIESGSLDLAYPMHSKCGLLEFSSNGRRLAGAAGSPGGVGDAWLNLWSVDYEIPASGCFMSGLRLTSTGEPVLKKGVQRIVAVLPFAAGEGDEDLGRAAGDYMESRLSGNPGLRLVERARVDDIVKELKFQKSAFVDKSSAVKAGKVLGAALIITGSIDRAGADLVVSARVIDVKTGEILGAREVHCGQCGADDIFDAIALLAPAIAED